MRDISLQLSTEVIIYIDRYNYNPHFKKLVKNRKTGLESRQWTNTDRYFTSLSGAIDYVAESKILDERSCRNIYQLLDRKSQLLKGLMFEIDKKLEKIQKELGK